MIADPRPSAPPGRARGWALAGALSLGVHAGLVGTALMFAAMVDPPRPLPVMPVEVVFETPAATEARSPAPALAISKPVRPVATVAAASVPRLLALPTTGKSHVASTPRQVSRPSPRTSGEAAQIRGPGLQSVDPPGNGPRLKAGATIVHGAKASDAISLTPAPVHRSRVPVPRSKPTPPARKVVKPTRTATEPQPVDQANPSDPMLRQLVETVERKRPANGSPMPSASREPARPIAVALRPPAKAESAGPASHVLRPAPQTGNRAPEYPLLARRRGWQGRVILSVRVAISGSPLAVSVTASSGHRVLDEAAREAVRRWRFVPGRLAGVPVVATVEVPVVFRLD